MLAFDCSVDVVDSGQRSPFSLLAACLQQLADVLEAASDEQYVMRPVGVVDSSLGGHVRHCLDHFAALLRGATAGYIDYDDRERGTPLESCRAAALAAIRTFQERVARLNDAMLERPIRLRAIVSGDGLAVEAASSLGRELVFVLSHTIHHNALIAAMCKTLGIPLPERFGYAPATIAYLAGATCAR